MVKLVLVVCCSFAIAGTAVAADYRAALADAVVCKGEPADAVQNLVTEGGNHSADYAAGGFGEGTSYRSVVILGEAVALGGSTARTFVSETESSNFEFFAFTYGQFSGDHLAAVKMLSLLPSTDKELGHFERVIEDGETCPRTIRLTPVEGGFLLGCGWCNG